MVLRDALAMYLSRVSIHKKGHKQEQYRINTISSHALSDKNVDEITSVDIANYRDERLATKSVLGKPISPNTVRLELALLSDLFNIGQIEWGICKDNPVLRIRKPKLPNGRDRRLRPYEERKLLRKAAAHPNPELKVIIIVALETAMRQGEILSLLWENINFRSGVAHLPDTKNGCARDVPLTTRAREAFSKLGVKQSGPVFNYTSAGFKSVWRAMLHRLDIYDLHFHDLRHEAISRMFELGTLDVVEISTISGHKSLQMLKRYTHLRAHKLVAKLEKNRKRMRQDLLGFAAYPAVVTEEHEDAKIKVEFVDFEDLILKSSSRVRALERAKDILLREIANCIKDGRVLPSPSFIDDLIEMKPADIVLIDPL